MIDEDLKRSLNEKIESGNFVVADIPDYLSVFCQFGNVLDELQEEVQGWNRQIYFDMPGAGRYWIAIDQGRFTTGSGESAEEDLVLTMDAVDAAQIFSGELDAESAFMSGKLKIRGDLPDAIKFNELLEIVAEEIEY